MFRRLCLGILGLLAECRRSDVASAAKVRARIGPIQIVKPVNGHRNLETVPESLEIIRSLPGPLGVVSAVGPIHTGKSYLLNQLASDGSEPPDSGVTGFSVGYSVRAETDGIWATVVPQNSGEGSVILLDTEGLFSHNASATYDAKVFGITTLLSSEVIYNSVKFIDSQQVDALDALIRRARFFGLRSYARAKDAAGGSLGAFVSGLLPRQLSWVVQDFVQDLEDVPPETWLSRLLVEAEAVAEFFKTVDCVPLPVPAASSALLQKLDTVPQSQLSPDYRNALNQYKRRLMERALRNPKTKPTPSDSPAYHTISVITSGKGSNGVPIDGMDLAELISTLVSSANAAGNSIDDQDSSMFPELPSISKQVANLQLRLLEADFLKIFERDILSSISVAVKDGAPLSYEALEAVASRSANEMEQLWIGTVRVPGAADDNSALRRFRDALDRLTASAVERNAELIAEWCQDLSEATRMDFDEIAKSSTQGGPSLPQELGEKLQVASDALINQLRAKVGTRCESELEAASSAVKERRMQAESANQVAIESELGVIRDEALERCKQALSEPPLDLGALSESALNDAIESAKRQAQEEVSTRSSKFYRGNYSAGRIDVKMRLEAIGSAVQKRWEERCRRDAEEFLENADRDIRQQLVRSAPPPANIETITKVAEALGQQQRANLKERVICHDSAFGANFTTRLEELLADAAAQHDESNMRVISQIHKAEFKKLQLSLKNEVPTYRFSSKFIEHATEQAARVYTKTYNEYDSTSGITLSPEGRRIQSKSINSASRKWVDENVGDLIRHVKARTFVSVLLWSVGMSVLFISGYYLLRDGSVIKSAAIAIPGAVLIGFEATADVAWLVGLAAWLPFKTGSGDWPTIAVASLTGTFVVFSLWYLVDSYWNHPRIPRHSCYQEQHCFAERSPTTNRSSFRPSYHRTSYVDTCRM